MTYTAHKSIVRTIHQTDPDFRMVDGLTLVPRAGFYIVPECPAGYKQVIAECMSNGWLQPVAHVRDYELMMDRLYD